MHNNRDQYGYPDARARVYLDMNKDLAAQVFFERINDITKDMTISPVEQLSIIQPPATSHQSPIWFGSNDATLLKAFTTVANGVTSLHLRPLKRGNQYVLARLGGSTGPRVAQPRAKRRAGRRRRKKP
ncbi:MAG: hypothetical protein V1899_02120 [Planctomycetota bacterium]